MKLREGSRDASKTTKVVAGIIVATLGAVASILSIIAFIKSNDAPDKFEGQITRPEATKNFVAWRATPPATTRVLDRGDARFDVLVQRRTERLGTASAELRPPVGQPQLTAAQAWSIAGMKVQPGRRKPSVRLATFVDPDFPEAAGPDNRMVPVAKRALVWVVVVHDAPAGFISGPVGRQERRPARQYACTNSMPVHAMTGASLGFWQDCWPVAGRTDRESA